MGIAGVLILGFVLFFAWFDYTSPVNEAGREYRRNVKSYQNTEIETMDDVYERLDVLDAHFNSTTFDKVQNAEKKEVTYSDIEILFGEPHKVVEDVDMEYADTVYQYFYEDITVNFHQRFRTIDEFVLENFTGTLYDSSALDQLFVHAIINHQTYSNKVNDQFELVTEKNVPQFILNHTSTRNIQQSGWRTWSFNRKHYFDDGMGEYAPNEYLNLQFKEEEDTIALYLMERRYHASYLEEDTQMEFDRKQEAVFTFSEFFDQKELNELEEQVVVGDFTDELGDISRMNYDFREGVLYVSWLMNDGENIKEVMAIVPVTDDEIISDISDLINLEITEFSTETIYDSERILNRNTFIGNK